MENIWPFLRLYLGLLLLNVCEGYPIDPSRTSGGAAEWTYLSPVLAVAFLMAAVLLVTGCVCCRQNKGFQEFTDSASSHSLSGAGGGYVNSAASTTEFTIFPPAQNTVVASHNQPGDRSSVVRFEPLPDIKPPQVHTRRPAAFNNVVNHGLSADDWFQDPHVNFPRQQLKYVRELGCGWFGRVVEGEAQNIVPGEKSTRVVVKILHEDATTTDQMYFLHEVKPYRDLSHPNVLRLLGRCLETDPFLVLLESCPSGDLKSFLSQNIATAEALNKQGITLRMACNISEGLQHLHNNGFVHTDLAARNCLVTPDLTVKVGDYGTSIDIFKEDYYCAGDVALPIRWCAPETLHCTETTIETKEVTQAANVWNLGVVLWEICEFGKLPYTELSDDEVIVKVLGEASYRLPPPSLSSQHGQNMYLLMKQCWSPKNVRPALAQVCAMLNHLYSSWERYGQDGDNTSLKTDEDFERRWEMFKPNTIPKTDNHVPSKDSTPIVLSPAHLATEKPQLHLCTDTLSVDRNSTTPLTTSPQPSLASSSGGDFYLPTLHQRHKSPSLQNLHGSIEDLSERVEQVAWQRVDEQDETSSQPSSDEREKIVEEKTTLLEPDFDSWLRGVETTNEEDAKFVRKISEAIRDLDNALALEKTSSSSSSEASSHCTSQQQSPAKDITNVMTEENVVLDFRLGRADSGVSSDDREMTFQPDSLQEDSYLECAKNRGTDSGTDTEDETWRRRIERGEFSEKVKEKSKSVADLMILTHIECSDGSDSEPPSLTWSIDRSSNGRGSFRLRHGSVNKNTPMLAYSSENDIHGAVLGDDFRNTLKRLQAEVQRTVAKHIIPVSDTEEQALLPSNHNRDENFLVIDASEETQKKSKIGNDVSKVPEEDSAITLVDNVPQTNVIECCICRLDGKGNANDGLQCYHSIHTEFKSNSGEENICSKKVNELLQNTSSITQPNSCHKMENKITPLHFGISQASNIGTAITSKVLPVAVAVGVTSDIEKKTSPFELEMSHVSSIETIPKSLPVLVDVMPDFENKTSPLQSEMPHMSDTELTSIYKNMPVLVDDISGFENKTFRLQSEIFHVSDIETTSQGLPVMDVISGTENKTSPLRSEISVSDIETTSQALPVVNVTSGTKNKISPFMTGISSVSDIKAVSKVLPVDLDITCSSEDKTSASQSEMSHTSDIEETSQDLHFVVDVTHSSENKTPALHSEISPSLDRQTAHKDLYIDVEVAEKNFSLQSMMSTTSDTETVPKKVPITVDIISGVESKISPLQSEMSPTSDIETTSQGLPVVDAMPGIENKTSPLKSEMPRASEIDAVAVAITRSTENKTSPLQSEMSSISDIETSKTLPVDVITSGIWNKTSPLQFEMSHVSDFEISKSLPVTVDMSNIDSKTSPVKPLMSHPTNIETTSKNLPVDMDITHSTMNKMSALQSGISPSSNIEETIKALPLAVGTTESKTVGLEFEIPTISRIETALKGLPVAMGITLSTEKETAASTNLELETTYKGLPVGMGILQSAENKTSLLKSEMFHVSDIETVSKGLPVFGDITSGTDIKTALLQFETLPSSDIEITSKVLPLAGDDTSSVDKKSSALQSETYTTTDFERTSKGLPLYAGVIQNNENKISALQSGTSTISDTETASKGLTVSMHIKSSTENQTFPLESEKGHTSDIKAPLKSVPVAVDVKSNAENKVTVLQSEKSPSSEVETVSKGLHVDMAENKASPLLSGLSHASDIATVFEGLPVAVESSENEVTPSHSDASHASNMETIFKGLSVVDMAENKVSSLQSEISCASDIELTSKGLPVVMEGTENKASPLQSEIPHASDIETISKGLPAVVDSTENKAFPLQSEISRASDIETVSKDLPVVESTKNKFSPLHSNLSHASNVEIAFKGLPVAVESTENKVFPLQSEMSHASDIETVSKDLPVVESTENKACSFHSNLSHASNIETTFKGLPVAVESTENKVSPLQSETSHASVKQAISKGLPVVESAENKACILQAEISHASDLETISKGLPIGESTENRVSLLQSEISHASDVQTISKDLPVMKITENKASPLHSNLSHASNIETTFQVLPVAVESAEKNVSPSQPCALDIETTFKDLPIVVESTEKNVPPLQSEISRESDIEMTFKDLPIVVESTENKASPLQLDISHTSNIETAFKGLPVAVESTESKVSPSYSDAPHVSSIETAFKGLPVAVESTESKVSPSHSDAPHASSIETAFKGLPVAVESTESKVSPSHSDAPHASNIETAFKGLPVAVESTESKVSPHSDAPHASNIETSFKGLPIAVESTESKVSPHSDAPHASSIETAFKGLPVAVESTESKVSPSHSDAPHASSIETAFKGLPVAVESTESKVSPHSDAPHASNIETSFKGLPIAVESTESKVSPHSDAPHASSIETAFKGLPVAVESTESKVSPSHSDAPRASSIETAFKGLPVAVESIENKISPSHSDAPHVSSIETAFKGLPVAVESTESKVSPSFSDAPHASSIETAFKGLRVAVESTVNKVSPSHSDASHASNIETAFKGLPVAVESTESKVSPSHSDAPHVSSIETAFKGLPVAVESTESKVSPSYSDAPNVSSIETAFKGLPVAVESIESKVSPSYSDAPHASSIETAFKGLRVALESTESKVSPSHSDASHASNIETAFKGLPVAVESIENKISPSHSDASDASNIETAFKGLPVAVESIENKISPSHSDASDASNIETAFKGLPVAVESIENKISPSHSDAPHASNIETALKGLPVAVESTESKVSPSHSDASHVSSIETAFKGLPVALESTESKVSPSYSDAPHVSSIETAFKGLRVAVESTESKVSPSYSDAPHASSIETAFKGLPVAVESTESQVSPSYSDAPHASSIETAFKGLRVAVESTESKVSPSYSDAPHASSIETAFKGLPVAVESTESKVSPSYSDAPHVSSIETAFKGLPVAVESTESKVSPSYSDAPHVSSIETAFKGLRVAVESTESKVSPSYSDAPHASSIETAFKGLPVAVESTESQVSPSYSDAPHASSIETAFKGLRVAVESTESKVSPSYSDAPHASSIETAFKGLPVAVESTVNKVSPSHSDASNASNIETTFRGLPVALKSTENKTSPSFSDIETVSTGVPVVVSVAENMTSPLESVMSSVSEIEAASKGLPVAVDVTSDIENKTSVLKSEVPHASDTKTTEGLPFANTRSPDVKEDVPSVILGACEDYTLDYFRGLKSTLKEESQQPNNLAQFENASSNEQHLVDYSIDSWEKHLSSAFHDHEERTDMFELTFKESANFFDDEDDSVVELYIDQPQGSSEITAFEPSEKGRQNSIGINQASNFLTVGLPAALTSRDVLYMEEKLKNPGLCIPSLNVIAATPVPSGRSSPEVTEEPVQGEVEESGSNSAGNGFNKTVEKSQKECDPCFNFPIVLNDGQWNEGEELADIVKSEHRNEEENLEKGRSCDKHYTPENVMDSNKLNGHDFCVQDATEVKTSKCENKIECVLQNVHKHFTSKPEDGIHKELLPNDMQITKESKPLDTCNDHHTSHKLDAIQTKTSEQLSAIGSHSSQEDLLIAEDSVFGRPKSFVQDLFSPDLMKHSEQVELSVALSHMEGRQGPQVFGEKEANQVSAALNSWKQSGQQSRMLMEDFLLGERLASGPFEEEEMAKQSTPDDERSSDSGFRDKGSLSESCDDACDEKYHLEDIEAELEESNKSGYERDKNVTAQDEWLDKLPPAGGKMFQDENPSISTNSQAALSLSVDSDKDVYSDSVFTSEVEGGFGEKEADTYFSSGAVSEEQDVGNITEQDDTSKSGWYLHPPVKSQELCEGSGWTTSSRTSDNNGNDNSYVSFNLEEEFVTAIRNELREKLPCSALHQQQQMEEEEEEEEELDEDEERRDIVIHYNTYPAPLSPILEERESVSSITTTLSDHVSPFAHSRDILKSGSDSEPLSPVFMLDPKEEAAEMDAKRFEQEIREALENCSISSEEISSLSDENAKKSSVLFEDLDHQSKEEVVVVRNTNNNNSEDDDLLVVDTETNKATLLESPKPKSHLAFVRKAVEESVATPSDDEELTVGINTDTYVINKSRFSDDSMIEKQKNTSSDEEVYTPDSISPENAVTASSLFSPDTENMSDFFLTPSEKSPSNNGDLLLHNLNNNAETGPLLDTVQELVANNEAAEIISELQNASIRNNNSILLFNANNNDNIVPEMPFKRNITVGDNWLGSRVSENDNSVIISVEEIDESSDKLDRLGYLRSPNLEVPREESEERDWSLPNLDAALLSTKAPMPSPEEESWKQIPSMLAFSDLNEVMARCGSNAEEEEEEEEEDEDPYPYQVDDNDLMSTSFSVNPDEQECYTPDWESGDSEDDNNSSSSGEFIWKEGDREASVKAVDISAAAATAVSVAAKYDGLSEFPMEVIAEEDEDEEEEDDADGSSSCGSGTEFVPSAWNSEATPNRSALRSPDKRSDHKKNVSFKKQKYHCVYEYPRETSDSDSEGFDSPTRRPHWSSMSYQQPVVDYASFADWELLDADALPADSQDTDTDPDDNPSQQQLDFYKLSSVDYDFGCGGMVSEDGEFFISSSARPFQFSAAGSNSAEVSGSQFFPGATTQVEDVSLDFITPDSGITDMNVQSGSMVEPREEDAEVSAVMNKVTEWEPDEDAAAVGCDEVPASPSSPMSPSGLGELRHTRDRLKLDLPTKNTAFVLDPPALGKRRAVETVKGEASLLDSGEETEDSGIESSNGALTSSKTLSLADSMKDTKV